MIKIGDRIKAEGREEARFATVKNIGKETIDIEWDHFPGKITNYKIKEVVDFWFFNGSLLKESDFGGCDHQWIDYHGFAETYKFCQKCDLKDS